MLSIVVSDFLFRKYPELPEGELTKLRASMVCEKHCMSLRRKSTWENSCFWERARKTPAAESALPFWQMRLKL